MEELIKRLERVIATGVPDKDGMHPISAETVLEVVKELSELGTNLAEVGTDVPDNNVGELISRQAALDALYHVDEYNSRSVEAIRNLPSAEPQIIRCKDCKHWIPYDWMFSEEWQSQNIDDYPEDDIGCDCCDMAMKANDFCSRAERRTE